MATTTIMHPSAPTPTPRLNAPLSTLPTRPRSHPIELPPIRQAVPELDTAPACEASRFQSTTDAAPIPVEARTSSPYAQKRRLLTPEPQDRTPPSRQTPPFRSSPVGNANMNALPTSASQGPLPPFAAELQYPSRGYPEPAPPPATRLFDPRAGAGADYPTAAAYARERYDAAGPYQAPQYAVYDGGGAGKRGREFVVAGSAYPVVSGGGYVGDVHGGEGAGVDGKGGQGGRKRRGNLPKETTDKLRAWFVGHLHHPYPTEDEKQELMARTGLQMNQISNWFINARRRQLPSMISNARAETAATANGAGGANGAVNGGPGGASNGQTSRDESDGSSYGGGSPGRGGRL